MVKTLFFTVFLLFLAAFGVHNAFADDLVGACGKPPAAELKTEGQIYCNIYDRRLAYREEDTKFQKLMDERRQNFEAPHQAVLKKYDEDVKTLYESQVNTAQKPAPAGEAYGPAINQ